MLSSTSRTTVSTMAPLIAPLTSTSLATLARRRLALVLTVTTIGNPLGGVSQHATRHGLVTHLELGNTCLQLLPRREIICCVCLQRCRHDLAHPRRKLMGKTLIGQIRVMHFLFGDLDDLGQIPAVPVHGSRHEAILQGEWSVEGALWLYQCPSGFEVNGNGSNVTRPSLPHPLGLLFASWLPLPPPRHDVLGFGAVNEILVAQAGHDEPQLLALFAPHRRDDPMAIDVGEMMGSLGGEELECRGPIEVPVGRH